MLLKAQEDINQYDYKKMMSDFETETRHKKIINGIKNKWRIASTKYLEKVDLIKDRNKKLDKKRQREYKKRYKEKEVDEEEEFYTPEEIELLDKFHDFTSHRFEDDEIYDIMLKFNNNEELIKNELNEMLKVLRRGDEYNWTEIGKSN